MNAWHGVQLMTINQNRQPSERDMSHSNDWDGILWMCFVLFSWHFWIFYSHLLNIFWNFWFSISLFERLNHCPLRVNAYGHFSRRQRISLLACDQFHHQWHLKLFPFLMNRFGYLVFLMRLARVILRSTTTFGWPIRFEVIDQPFRLDYYEKFMWNQKADYNIYDNYIVAMNWQQTNSADWLESRNKA